MMADAKRDSESNGTRARLTDYCLFGALLPLLFISWKDSATSNSNLHEMAHLAVAQHVGESFRQDSQERLLTDVPCNVPQKNYRQHPEVSQECIAAGQLATQRPKGGVTLTFSTRLTPAITAAVPASNDNN
jgi:hypothetical protein